VKLILGLLKPDKGEVIYPGGQPLEIGYLPQVNDFDRKFPISVKEVILSGLLNKQKILFPFSRKEKERMSNLIKRLKLDGIEHKPIGNLSGGQMQRVFLGRALVSNPTLLILDEPDAFMDNTFEGELYELLGELNQEMAILVVSHDIGTISYHVKTIACVNQQLHYHRSNIITEKQLEAYNCPIQLITHGEVPHQVLKKHE
jgi:zinc transport system ATP-binding protein